MTCVRCEQPIDDELTETKLGPMDRDCAEEAWSKGAFGPIDHGDSIWPK